VSSHFLFSLATLYCHAENNSVEKEEVTIVKPVVEAKWQ